MGLTRILIMHYLVPFLKHYIKHFGLFVGFWHQLSFILTTASHLSSDCVNSQINVFVIEAVVGDGRFSIADA